MVFVFMNRFAEFKKLDVPENSGIEKISTFLERSGFVHVMSSSSEFKEWIRQLSFEEFREHLGRLNGIIREIPIAKREVDGENVSVGNMTMGVDFIPPHAEDKELLLKEAFEKMQAMDNLEDQGLLLYLVIQYLHLFNDGNGRLGRLLFYLIQKIQDSSEVDAKEMRGLLSHDGVSGPGRNLFHKGIKAPFYISHTMNQVVAREILSEEFTQRYRKIYPVDLMAGSVSIDNKTLNPEIKNQLEAVASEAGGGVFSFRDLTMVKYLENHNVLDEYEVSLEVNEGLQKTIYRYDANELLTSISEEGAKEILAISREIKKEFVKRLIDVISDPEEYRINEEKRVKDLFYQKEES